MAKTTMTKSKWMLVVLLMIALGATAINRSMASNQQQDHQHHQQALQTQAQPSASLPPLIADGAKDPSAIPDLVAYEILLDSVAENAAISEPERVRARGLAKKTGISADKLETLKNTANKFKEDINGFDAQARELKDRHWPKPDQSVRGQLNALQHQKEAALRQAFRSLLEGLSDADKESLNKRLLEIKGKVKVYQDVPIEKYQGK